MTLTISDEEMIKRGNESICKRDLQLFFKRLRKHMNRKGVKYFACGEYGETFGRPHYHGVVFGIALSELDTYYNHLLSKSRKPVYSSKVLDKLWIHGYNSVGTVTYDSARYTADYIFKSYDGEKAEEVYGDKERPFILASKGLGLDFALQNKEQILQDMSCKINGGFCGLPRYYKKRLEVDSQSCADKAAGADKKIVEVWRRRGIKDVEDAEWIIGLKREEAKRQHVKNLETMKQLYKKSF